MAIRPEARSRDALAACLGAALVMACDSAKVRGNPDPPAPAESSRPAPASALRPALADLQGAWWSDSTHPTAAFGILGDQVWLDPEADLNPCRVVGDTLVFDLDGGTRQVRNRILRLAGDTLRLENVATGDRWEVIRAGRNDP